MSTDNNKDSRKPFEVTVVDSRRPVRVSEREGIAAADLVVSEHEALTALEQSPGSDAVFEKVPAFRDISAWLPVATFTTCGKSGTARYLDLWDVDHFDGFTDMQRNLDECRAWFSATGYGSWGSAQTKTGRINCWFTAPEDGNYLCTARLQSYGGDALVECLIDDNSFGFLPVSGTITQPHPCSLSAGNHHFRIRQQSGSFFFLSLAVWRA